jgi:predicted DNA-binding protein
MADQDTRMVLRTVYLTPDVDEALRLGAFKAGRTKNDLIRDAIKQYLKAGFVAKATSKGKVGAKSTSGTGVKKVSAKKATATIAAE